MDYFKKIAADMKQESRKKIVGRKPLSAGPINLGLPQRQPFVTFAKRRHKMLDLAQHRKRGSYH